MRPLGVGTRKRTLTEPVGMVSCTLDPKSVFPKGHPMPDQPDEKEIKKLADQLKKDADCFKKSAEALEKATKDTRKYDRMMEMMSNVLKSQDDVMKAIAKNMR
jgi:hypothetical protein